MPTYHIHIRGQVQGVGFRPFVYNLARSMKLVGWVNNAVDGVHIRIKAETEKALLFYQKVLDKAPDLSVITSHHLNLIQEESFDQFEIAHSDQKGQANVLITPDFAMCLDCRDELLSTQNRRFGYPFITCTNCGPRYSIVTNLPYDRENTTMAAFSFCKACGKEYLDPLDRRYYSQTNSCNQCGIRLSLYNKTGDLYTENTQKALSLCIEALDQGQIVAIKGIGGFLILTDATNSQAIALLRKRKHRPEKPFAVLYPNLALLQNDVTLCQEEIDLLKSPRAPIVLLAAKKNLPSGLDAEAVASGLHQIGAMLPYTPLYELLLQKLNRPIVATSGNVSGTPIVFLDQNAMDNLPAIADLLLLNNRKISVPQDDSVIRVTEKEKQSIVIRRSRGIAPTHLEIGLEWPSETILSMGAFLKSTFTLLHQKNSYVSQYLGKLDYLETQVNYRHTLNHFLRLFDAKVDRIIIDEHPAYYSSKLGLELAADWGVPLAKVQHHQAHFGAVLAENKLLDVKTPVLGVIWDGTGLGSDGQIWGGEFFSFKNKTISRIDHLAYFPWILQDKMAKEPRISALAACSGISDATTILVPKFTVQEWQIYQRLLAKPSLQSSSIGRLFDAVSSLLGLVDKSSYEGQAAMLLEQLAKQYQGRFDMQWAESYLYGLSNQQGIPTQLLLASLIEDIQNNFPKAAIAARFHFSLIHAIQIVIRDQGFKKVAFSGGVWQNTLLVDMAIHYLAGEADLYFHQQLSPNDECISYGSLICWLLNRNLKDAK